MKEKVFVCFTDKKTGRGFMYIPKGNKDTKGIKWYPENRRKQVVRSQVQSNLLYVGIVYCGNSKPLNENYLGIISHIQYHLTYLAGKPKGECSMLGK